MRRDDIAELRSQLEGLGADHVLTYSEFLDRSARAKIKEWTLGGELRLALNCVGGKETGEMAKLLGMDGFLGESDLERGGGRRDGGEETDEARSNLRRNGKDGALAPSKLVHLQETHGVRFSPSLLLSQLTPPKTRTGFWLSNWVETHPVERLAMMNELAQMVADGRLVEPPTEVVELAGDDEQVGRTVREVMKRAEAGKGKKVLLKFV